MGGSRAGEQHSMPASLTFMPSADMAPGMTTLPPLKFSTLATLAGAELAAPPRADLQGIPTSEISEASAGTTTQVACSSPTRKAALKFSSNRAVPPPGAVVLPSTLSRHALKANAAPFLLTRGTVDAVATSNLEPLFQAVLRWFGARAADAVWGTGISTCTLPPATTVVLLVPALARLRGSGGTEILLLLPSPRKSVERNGAPC
mmetsp:Transcript_7984/g.12070  ORF Transcript_7984/g.12070 Transcript_7984/m.12070 type:complete len:204 (+) Transcript_7984:300-911(+)